MTNQQDIATPSHTNEILNKYNLSAKKSLGQNFIIDTNILRNIVKTAAVDEKTTVIEVGPGIGALTEQIAKEAKEVFAFEIDDRLLSVLDDTLSPYDNVTILHQDILKVDFESFKEQYLEDTTRLVVIANLPYYITTPIIMHLIESSLEVDEMVLMMQKEVASRLEAKPSTKAYGSLSIAIQYYMDVEVAFTVPRTVFMPQPNVDSAIIRLKTLKEPPVQVKNEPLFFKIVRASFVQRRKTIWNNLKKALDDKQKEQELKEAFQKTNVDSSRRGESLTIEEFGQLADALVTCNLTDYFL
ncbi:16S rRNA (adenine1518-N6/adenine1519-N6)-dimethyltransferase [Atopostipes suicloacalis DSM 15692]|uniref:Ribosomal RNA small subunit methyltransferase A n=1 Tax=Atopostipes suicloacalis DSM 15692 TaxID=1121025 RepID=A0A1M4V3T0_9LACT|nr:16S rRNA (adenine(1518)-N(6)/adenine(1519)-N(6))-dimethyltransferase RsmA [Atopostipes suicloacalis]SHE63538.1 16S rRNA (adenine1518-N6/adenine1519-N6)-dimethyltransferase [Atopostipes suicloacalis DSM 15692]